MSSWPWRVWTTRTPWLLLHLTPLFLLQLNETSSSFEGTAYYERYWDNPTGQDAGKVSFEYYTTGLATRTFKVSQKIGNNWVHVTDHAKTTDWRSVTDDLDPAATGVRIEFSGTGLGSAQVRNIVVTRRTYLKSETVSVAEQVLVGTPMQKTLAIDYANIHTVHYKLTDIMPADANITLTTNDVLANGASEYGTYNFVLAVSADTVQKITANARFYNAEGRELVIPIEVAYKYAQTLTWGGDETIAVNEGDQLEIEEAIASSGLTVTYTSSDEAVVKYEEGAWVVMGPGEVIITASQAGNDAYFAATPLTKTVVVTGISTAVPAVMDANKATKTLVDGHIYILRGSKVYHL